jgi:hypothetical protein
MQPIKLKASTCATLGFIPRNPGYTLRNPGPWPKKLLPSTFCMLEPILSKKSPAVAYKPWTIPLKQIWRYKKENVGYKLQKDVEILGKPRLSPS